MNKDRIKAYGITIGIVSISIVSNVVLSYNKKLDTQFANNIIDYKSRVEYISYYEVDNDYESLSRTLYVNYLNATEILEGYEINSDNKIKLLNGLYMEMINKLSQETITMLELPDNFDDFAYMRNERGASIGWLSYAETLFHDDNYLEVIFDDVINNDLSLKLD